MRHALAISLTFLLGTTSLAEADLPEGVSYDDGYAFFKVISNGRMSNNRPSHEYDFRAHARLLGTGIAANSAFKFVVKRGRRTLLSFVCTGRHTWRVHRHRDNPPDMFQVDNCMDRSTRLDVDGELTVEVWFIDDATDEEHLARTHTVDVRRLRQENHQGRERPSDFIVNQHGFTPAAFIDQAPYRHQFMYGETANWNAVSVVFHRSSGSAPGTLTLRCTVDGERIEFPQHQVQHAAIGYRATDGTEVHRAGTSTEGDHIRFRADNYMLPITFGETTRPEYPKLEDHPGRWECMLRDSERRAVREFAFVVADGRVQAHPEEAGGDLHFPEGVHLMEVTVPDHGAIDERTDPASARAGAFYGRPWRSAEGRAMARRVPAIGDAFPRSARRRRGRR